MKASVRIYRTFTWEIDDTHPRRIGGVPSYTLVAHDEVQELIDGQWTAVPIVEAEKPEHPRLAREHKEAERTQSTMQEAFKQMFGDSVKPLKKK